MLFVRRTTRRPSIVGTIGHERRAAQELIMALYVLMAIVVGLVIYLFYAVINPEKF